MIQKYQPWECLPSSADLPDSDDTPVDNELQDLIPGLLKLILGQIWKERMDWFFGVDMGIYYDPNQPAIVPDGFLSLGVERIFSEELRLSYVLWEEENIIPSLILEVVSQTYRGEYGKKKDFYAELGALYYVVYSPKRRRHRLPLEIYHLVEGKYRPVSGHPLWMPEIGLGLGRERGTYQGITREWLYWYDAQGNRFPTPEEEVVRLQQELTQQQSQMQQERQRAEQERQRAERLAARLQQMGIDPTEM
ncbi:MAG: Uma2 family endonuclease [Leptolyngbyaceae bacterium]|nr:Uma2 family endonuclease [Leptolyngbyaceae bacterium]